MFMIRKTYRFSIVVAVIAIVLVAVLVAVLAAGCVSNPGTKADTSTIQPESAPTQPTSAPKQYTTLKTVFVPGPISTVDIADAKGFFSEQGIAIDNVGSVNGGTEAVQALAAGKIDFAGSAWQPWINANNRGAKLKVVVAGNGINSKEQGQLWLVHNNSNIRSANDLIGKKIAVNVLGAEADYATRAYLKKANLSIDQVQLIVVPWPQHEQVFKTNQVDVIAVSAPYSDKILAEDDARLLFSHYDVRGETASITYGFKEDYIGQHPDIAKGFVTAMAETEDWTVANPEEARKLVAELYVKKGSNASLAKYWGPKQARPHGLIVDNDVQWWLDAMASEGTIKAGEYKPSDYYTNEFNKYSNG